MEQLLKQIQELSEQEQKTLEQMVLKLSEEVGETAQAVLSYKKASGSEYKKLTKADVKEECADVILVALTLFFKLSETDKELDEFLSKKIKKWSAIIPLKEE
ncbi:MazG-like family protein [Bacillus sp. JCM 19041]|uniref:MazG-like family protein n=1 Tax=Bacillus sp. JCM 19041 TaxID=1460637 RepID=UPI0006CF5DEB